MVTEVSALQPWKLDHSIVVTLFEMVTEVRELQILKAQPPIVVTLLGMVTEVRELQLSKVYSLNLYTNKTYYAEVFLE